VSEGGDKTEEPTPKKMDDARKEGNVWKSRDLSGVVSFAVAMGVVKATWDGVEARVKTLFTFTFESVAHPAQLEVATKQVLIMGLTDLLLLCVPVALAAGVAGGLMEFLQVGSLFAIKAVMPKLEKLNPIEGMKNLVGKKQIVEALKNLLKLGVSAYTVFGVVKDSMGLVVSTIRGDAPTTMLTMGELVFRVVSKVVLLFVIFAIFDVWWQHKSWMKDQMMSKDDVKKEYKESEGDPHHKAKRKEMHQEIMEGAQMEAVASADVIVTNPDHLAVALKYDQEHDGAPRVIAKGFGARAEGIRERARGADVPLMRNVPLAHALIRVEVNQEIPEELYDAVAEVLNFVYQLKAPAPAGAA